MIIYKVINNLDEDIKKHLTSRINNAYIDSNNNIYILRINGKDYYIKKNSFDNFINTLKVVRINSKESLKKFYKGEGVFIYIVNLEVYKIFKKKKKKKK